MEGLVSLITFCFVMCYVDKITAKFVDPDVYRNVSEFITSRGYPLEEHTVTTADGYILSIQRIPYGKNESTKTPGKEVVLLFHGEIGDSKAWFLNIPEKALGNLLPDAGYDLWMVNNRGCAYSQKHVRYPTRSLRYWKFSFDEIAKYDAPATIDYVLNVTNQTALNLIGYSRGNTVGFALLSELPEYNKKVKLFVALAPVTFIGHFRTAVRYFIPFRLPIAAAITAVTQGEFVPQNAAVRIIIAKFCEVQDVELCKNVLFAIAGQDRKQLNETRIPIYSAQYIASSSVMSLLHYSQMYLSKCFCKYDHGLVGNLAKYKQVKPPDYELSRITSPVALFWSTNDKIADAIDVGILKGKLTTTVYDFHVPEYNHFDFIWAINSPEMVYKPILELLANHSTTNRT